MKSGIINTILITLAVVVVCLYNNNKIESFTAPGLVYNIPSQWWHPKQYDTADWLVTMFPDQLSQPSCLSYNRGDTGPLNFNASSYRFWKF